MKQIKLEVGKTYRNREGEEVKITEFYKETQYPYRGNKGKWYTESGQWCDTESPADLIAEVPSETRHAFTVPDGVKKVIVEQVGNRIIVEMVPEKEPKPGDVCINEQGSVYIFKEAASKHIHRHYAWLGRDGREVFNESAIAGRPATAEEAQLLFDALKKAGKRWNPETMQVEDVPEIDRIREWVEANAEYGYYDHEDVVEAIEAYLKQKEGKQ